MEGERVSRAMQGPRLQTSFAELLGEVSFQGVSHIGVTGILGTCSFSVKNPQNKQTVFYNIIKYSYFW